MRWLVLLLLLACDAPVATMAPDFAVVSAGAGGGGVYVLTCWDGPYLYDCDRPDGPRVLVELD